MNYTTARGPAFKLTIGCTLILQLAETSALTAFVGVISVDFARLKLSSLALSIYFITTTTGVTAYNISSMLRSMVAALEVLFTVFLL
jgi:hypothetical protein